MTHRPSLSLSLALALALYIPVFFALWTLWEFWGKDLVNATLPNEVLAQLVKSGVVKNLVWTLPALLLLLRFRDRMAIPPEKMFTAKVRWGRLLPLFLVLTLWVLAGALLQKGRLAVSDSFGADELIIVLFVGLTEETVFRGWLLNAAVPLLGQWPAILCNAGLFLAIHFPVWLHTGAFFTNFANLGFAGILALSVIFSLAFLRSGSIFVPIALHMYWDLLALLFL